MKEFRVVVKVSKEDEVKVIANSEEEAREKVYNAIYWNEVDGELVNCRNFNYVGGYSTEPVIEVEGWRELKAV